MGLRDGNLQVRGDAIAPNTRFPEHHYLVHFLTAIVYFFIPLSINWMIRKFPLNPNKSVLMLLGVFTVTSGITELMSLGMCPPRFEIVAEVLAFVKLSSAFVLFATVLMLFRLTPESEQLRIYEQTLKRRAVEVDQLLGHLHAQKAVGLRYRHMMQELSSSLDKYDILRTAVSELGKNLDLGECGLWMPTDNGSKLLLCRTFRNQMTIGIVHSVKDSVVQQVFSSEKAIKIPTTCPLARTALVDGSLVPKEIVATRVPLPKFSFVESNGLPGFQYSDGYAVVVLMFTVASGRRWREHEMELVDYIIQQVAIALSHASIVEESIQFHDRLREHSFYLEMKAENAERVLCLHRDFVTIMSKLMQMPMESLSASTSLLQETSLTSQQHLMVEDISKTTRFLSDMITDVSEFSGIEGGSIQFNLTSFNLHLLLQQIIDLIKPVAAIKTLDVSFLLEADVPEVVVSDAKLLRQVILNVVSNAVKFTREGRISISANMAGPAIIADLGDPLSYPRWNGRSYFLEMKVIDTGCGFSPPDIPIRFAKFTGHLIKTTEDTSRMQSYNGLALSLSMRYRAAPDKKYIFSVEVFELIQKITHTEKAYSWKGDISRIMELMGGKLSLQSEGPGRGCTATLIARLGRADALEEAAHA